MRRVGLAIAVVVLLVAGCSSRGAVPVGNATDLVRTTSPAGIRRGQITLTVDDTLAQVAADGRLHTVYIPARGPRGGILGYPDWSPDGSRIAFTADTITRASEYNGLHVLDVVTGRDQRLIGCVQDPCNFWPGIDWSPDGTRIAFSEATGRALDRGSIWLVNTDGSGLRKLDAGGEWSDWAPSWSPGGTRIAISGFRHAPASSGRGDPAFGRSSIYVIRSNGSHRALVAARGRSPAWSPDGTEIAYIRLGQPDLNNSGLSRDCQVWERHPDGTRPILLLHESSCRDWSNLAWSPDGRQIAVGLDVIMNYLGGGVTPLGLSRNALYAVGSGPAW